MRGATPTRPEPAPAGALGAALLVFARAPEPGHVKTRLAALLGDKGAARLHARLVRRTLWTAKRARFDSTEICCSPHLNFPFFIQIERQFHVSLQLQGSGSLGDRMYRAFKRALRSNPHVVLIGSDCPALTPADLRAAAKALKAGADAVLSPAEDGGYALIGLRRVSRRLFASVEWGSPDVLAQTRSRLKRLGWRWSELRTVWDVDRPEDVVRLRKAGLLRASERP